MMDRNGDPLPPERATWEESHASNTLEYLAGILDKAQRNHIPDRPYPPDSFECRYCPYHSLCRGPRTITDEPDEPFTAAVQATDPDTLEAAESWLRMDPELKRVKRTLQNASDNANKADVIAGNLRAGYFQPKKPPLYDPTLLRQRIPADILKECLMPFQDRREGFWIRRND